jgi:hypothetical protein
MIFKDNIYLLKISLISISFICFTFYKHNNVLNDENELLKKENELLKKENLILKKENFLLKEENFLLKEENFLLKEENNINITKINNLYSLFEDKDVW